MSSQDSLKSRVAEAALEYLGSEEIIGIGSGSTIRHFIECLGSRRHRLEGAVSSSEATTEQLKAIGIPVYSLNEVGTLSLYIDSADECNAQKQLLKGGGGALTREKILATQSKKFLCIIDQSKQVKNLGEVFPVVVEVLPMARSAIARELIKLQGNPVYRKDFRTDNGNEILDVYGLNMVDPLRVEETLKQLPGVVESGVFAKRRPDKVLVANTKGIEYF